ncbi:hypothetical protein Pan216_06360 [Planctomycetes bacterium Pan216]|uniref:Uncharacterized protein n=1 Tax=Kolteria novifilia TaxID=2527975 RepID=A0A518AYK8_9BACT|nr:hypothetical protein Pan216_06360 [Planctomycetes bacterium Pan216]
MKQLLCAGIAVCCLGFAVEEASAGYRVLFVGSEARAVQSAERGSGYLGLGSTPSAAGNLSGGSCPTCVPGGSSSKDFGAGVPNQIVTFQHPYTGKAITVPLTLPVGKPTVKIKQDRVVYDYGFLKNRVVVLFKPCGKVEVDYRQF